MNGYLPEGFLRPPGIDSAPTAGSQFTNASQMNSDPCRSERLDIRDDQSPGPRYAHIGPRDRTVGMQHQALSCIFVHQRQPLERTAAGGPIVNEVTGPDVVLEPGWLLDAAIVLVPGFGPNFLGFLSLKGRRSPRLFQSRRTRLRFTVQPPRTSRA